MIRTSWIQVHSGPDPLRLSIRQISKSRMTWTSSPTLLSSTAFNIQAYFTEHMPYKIIEQFTHKFEQSIVGWERNISSLKNPIIHIYIIAFGTIEKTNVNLTLPVPYHSWQLCPVLSEVRYIYRNISWCEKSKSKCLWKIWAQSHDDVNVWLGRSDEAFIVSWTHTHLSIHWGYTAKDQRRNSQWNASEK